MTKTNPINDLKLAMDAVSAAILKLAESKPVTTSCEVTQPIKLELDYERLGAVIADAIDGRSIVEQPVQKSEAVKKKAEATKVKAEPKPEIDDIDSLDDDDLEPTPTPKKKVDTDEVPDDLEPKETTAPKKTEASPKKDTKPVAKTVADDDDDLDVTFIPTDEEAKQARIQNYIDNPSKIRKVIVQLMAKHRNSFVKAIKDRIEVTSIESLISEENIATTADVIVNFEDSAAA